MSGTKINLDGFVDVINEVRPNVPSVLSHYVSFDKAKHIIGSGKDCGDVYCSKCGKENLLNDNSEIWTGVSKFLHFLKSTKVLRDDIFQMLNREICCAAVLSRLENDGFSPLYPHIFCLTSELDAPYQWKNYTDYETGGYSFDFEHSKLQSAIDKLNQNNVSILLLPCFYCEHDESDIVRIFERLICDNIEHFSMLNKTGISNRELFWKLRNLIFYVAPIIKAGKWHREREWRIVLHSKEYSGEYVRSHISDVCAHPINLLSSITISPHGDREKLIRELKRLVVYKADAAVSVWPSLIDKSVIDYYITNRDCADNDDTYEDYVLMATRQSRRVEVLSRVCGG